MKLAPRLRMTHLMAFVLPLLERPPRLLRPAFGRSSRQGAGTLLQDELEIVFGGVVALVEERALAQLSDRLAEQAAASEVAQAFEPHRAVPGSESEDRRHHQMCLRALGNRPDTPREPGKPKRHVGAHDRVGLRGRLPVFTRDREEGVGPVAPEQAVCRAIEHRASRLSAVSDRSVDPKDLDPVGRCQHGAAEQHEWDRQAEGKDARGGGEQRPPHVRCPHVSGRRASSFAAAISARAPTRAARTNGAAPPSVERPGSTVRFAACATNAAFGSSTRVSRAGTTPGLTLTTLRSIPSRSYWAVTVSSRCRSESASARSLTRTTWGFSTCCRLTSFRARTRPLEIFVPPAIGAHG